MFFKENAAVNFRQQNRKPLYDFDSLRLRSSVHFYHAHIPLALTRTMKTLFQRKICVWHKSSVGLFATKTFSHPNHGATMRLSILAGIDYGMGQTNIDHKTGIRYGVASLHDVTQAWHDASEADYGDATCPDCGQIAVDPENECDSENWTRAKGSCGDYACSSCETLFDAQDAFGDEPQGFTLDDGEYQATQGGSGDSDIFVLKSPFYTFGPFCSPCAPGAVYLPDATGNEDEGHKAYCFGHDWFDDGKAPYTVYSIATGAVVEPS